MINCNKFIIHFNYLCVKNLLIACNAAAFVLFLSHYHVSKTKSRPNRQDKTDKHDFSTQPHCIQVYEN